MAVVLCLALALPAWAEEPEANIVPIEEGQAAPFAGLLLDEPTFLGVARQRLIVDELAAKLQIRDRLLADLTGQLATARARECPACEGSSWIDRNGFWLGAGVGLVLAGALVWGAVEILDTR